jgi:hypothetical protein
MQDMHASTAVTSVPSPPSRHCEPRNTAVACGAHGPGVCGAPGRCAEARAEGDQRTGEGSLLCCVCRKARTHASKTSAGAL